MSLNEIFTDDTAPFRTVYETAQAVVADYMTLHNCKIEKVAEQLGTAKGYLYGMLDPNQTHRPLSVDRIIEITNLTGDTRIIDAIKEALNVSENRGESTVAEIMMVGLKIQSHTGSLSQTLFEAVKDGKIDEKEAEQIRRQAMNEITALYSIIGMTK